MNNMNESSALNQFVNMLTPDILSRWIGQTARPELPLNFVVIDWTGAWLAITEIAQRGSTIQLGRTFRNQFNLSEPVGVEAALQWLQELIQTEGIKGESAIVAAPRRFVAFKLLTLPNVADDRLGEAVGLQAETLFPVASNQLVVDFIAPPYQPQLPERAVLVAAMPTDQVERITNCVVSSGLKCLGIVVHDLALAHREYASSTDTIAVVSVNPTKLEFVVASAGVPILCYAGRAPEYDALATDIVSTLRRLMASLPAGAVARSLSRLHLIDCPPALSNTKPAINNNLLSLLKQSLGIEVTHRRAAYDELLKASAIIDAYSTAECRIDFLSPRQPIDHRRRSIEQRLRWVTIAALVLLMGYAMAVINTRRLSDRIAYLQNQQKSLQQVFDQKLPEWQSAAAVNRWQTQQIDYSQAVQDYLTNLPNTQDIVLTRLEVSRGLDGANAIEIEGIARQTSCVNQLVDTMAASPRYNKPQLRRLEVKHGDNRYGADFALSIALRGNEHVQP